MSVCASVNVETEGGWVLRRTGHELEGFGDVSSELLGVGHFDLRHGCGVVSGVEWELRFDELAQ